MAKYINTFEIHGDPVTFEADSIEAAAQETAQALLGCGMYRRVGDYVQLEPNDDGEYLPEDAYRVGNMDEIEWIDRLYDAADESGRVPWATFLDFVAETLQEAGGDQ